MQPQIKPDHSASILYIANESVNPSFNFTQPIKEIEHYYLMMAKESIPVLYQSRVLSNIRFEFIQLENLCKGIQLLNEFPESTKARIAKFPENIVHYLDQEKVAFQQKFVQP